ncbi:hypothetical protein OS190_06660 [Sulfitobacter sp. F26204]|uniref:GbsR/MarR family transcriptional regulator n=1 Tax=Sulfitobacter sp. F26204 TaxID=2996014 RepID=UPI00225E51AF|nr:hypothetical protein [Sulfitobacter sp. F26204]MCX7559246.1 hypothetical protein [Sulfitobacter sp. F26204]
MTETKDELLSDAKSQFILYWGDMGSQWSVNRSVAQIQALLFLSVKPMNAEQIVEELGIARSNALTFLKELISWKLIRRAPSHWPSLCRPARRCRVDPRQCW